MTTGMDLIGFDENRNIATSQNRFQVAGIDAMTLDSGFQGWNNMDCKTGWVMFT
jgi:hypothetical protein